MSRNVEVQSSLSLADIFRGVLQRKILLVTCLGLSLLGGLLFLVVNKPSYLAETQVIIEDLATPFDRTTSTQDSTAFPDKVNDRMVLSQVSVLKSNDIYARVVDQLGLEQKTEYNSQLRTPGVLGKYLIALGFKDDPAAYKPKDLAAKSLMGSVTVYPVPDSNVIGIKSVSGDGALSAATANAIAETYVLSTHEVSASSTDRARTWLAKQIDDLRAQVSAAESAVEKYRSEAGLLKGTSSTLGTQQISELNTQITVAETAAAEANARVNEIKSLLKATGRVDASSEVLSSPLIQNLREQQVAAQRKISELSAIYLANHPKMIAAEKELNAINAQVRPEALKIIDSLVGQAKVAQARAAALRAQLDNLKGSESEANFSDVKLKSLQREADASRALLETMLGRFADVSARQDSSTQPGFARVIQRAVAPPTPYFPKSGPTLVLCALAGLALGLGLAFVLEVLAQGTSLPAAPAARHHALQNDKTRDIKIPAWDLAEQSSAPTRSPSVPKGDAPSPQDKSATVLSIMPAALTASAAMDMIDNASDARMAEAVERVAATLSGFRDKLAHKVFAFTSIGSSAPNSALTVVATGRALAAHGAKVIAIDVAQGSAGFEALLGIEQGQGLTDLIAGKADVKKIVGLDPGSAMHVMRIGQSLGAESLAKLQSRLPAILNALKPLYGYLLLHAGEANAATAALVNASDVVVLLASQARLKDAAEAATTIEQDGKAKAVLLKLDPQAAPFRTGAASA